MNKNQFFKPTVLYKEYMILDMIEKNSRVTQREISKEIGIALSMVNDHLDQFEKERLVKRVKHSTKHVEYLITKKGTERRKLLNIWYLKASQGIYLQAKENITKFLNHIIEKGFKQILLYGAGEVAEIILSVLNDDNKLPLEVLAVIDDDITKIGTILGGVKVIKLCEMDLFEFDCILISTHGFYNELRDKIHSINNGISIINYFEES